MEEGDYNGLVAVMGHLMAVKDRQTVTDEMFEPLKQTIELLKTYGQEMPEEVHTQLQVQRAYVNFFSSRNAIYCTCMLRKKIFSYYLVSLTTSYGRRDPHTRKSVCSDLTVAVA